MRLQPFSPNFLIKVPKKDEIDKREKIGNVYLHPSFVWLTRNTQCGIIHNISQGAKEQIPEAKVGDMLITHHFVQGSHSSQETRRDFLVYADETYNYYNVISKEHNGYNNQSYAIYNGSTIIPHKQYVFLEKDLLRDQPNEFGYFETSDDIQNKLDKIKSEIMSLAKTRSNPEIARAIQEKEREQLKITKQIHAKEYIPVKIAYANPSLGIPNGSTVYALSIACATIIDFMGKEYRVVESKYIGAID